MYTIKKTFTILTLVLLMLSCKSNNNSNDKETLIVDSKETITGSLNVIDNANQLVNETITFPSLDGLTITADVYKINNTPISILLCHQAGFSRGEYKETALLLNSYGYSVMAIDQRSGEGVNGIVNETAKLAKTKKLDTKYINDKPDIEAAIDFVFKNNGNRKIIVVGSSYSATLVLLIGKNNDKIKAVAAFSPGEYYKGMNIQSEIRGLEKPTFVTSSLSETEALSTLVVKMKSNRLIHYKPTKKGIHGSRALWVSTKDYKGYRVAFKAFLESI